MTSQSVTVQDGVQNFNEPKTTFSLLSPYTSFLGTTCFLVTQFPVS